MGCGYLVLRGLEEVVFDAGTDSKVPKREIGMVGLAIR
jgi:hypothetical protein